MVAKKQSRILFITPIEDYFDVNQPVLLLNKFNKDNLDFLVGSRDFKSAKKEGLSLVRFYSSKIIILIFFLVVGKQTIDPMSGFFIFKKKIFIKNQFKLFNQGYKILLDLLYSDKLDKKIYDQEKKSYWIKRKELVKDNFNLNDQF